MSPLQLHSSLERQERIITEKTNSLTVIGGGRMGLEFFQRPKPRELSLFDLSIGSLKDPTQSLPSANSLFFSGIYQKQLETVI